MNKCYMCNEEATTVEHVPPRCIFPEKKDIPKGLDFRKNLITVPSCNIHNTLKSSDDEFLLYVLVMNLPANNIAQHHFLTKIVRSFKRNPNKLKFLLSDTEPVTLFNPISQNDEQSIAVNIDRARFNQCFEHIGRALYFHNYNDKWPGKISVHADFLLASVKPEDNHNNMSIYELANKSDIVFKNQPFAGENPEIFKYQIAKSGDYIAMRLYFYGGCKITLAFL